MKKATVKPMSLIEFTEQFGTEEKCKEHLFNLRFAQGFTCPKCGNNHGNRIKTRNIMQCSKCNCQVSATVGTMMHNTKTEIRKWYYAIYLITSSKRGISSKELQRQLKVTYKTAWYLHKRIRQAMATAEEKYLLEGVVTMDEAFFTGKVEDGSEKKRGRGTDKSKVLLAVSLDKHGNPLYAKMQVTDNFKGKTIEKFAKNHIKKGSTISTDGFKAYQGQNIKKDYFHEFEVMDVADNQSNLKWLHIVISNAKSFLQGTYHGLSRTDLQLYLNEFCYRFNRRNMPHLVFEKLLNSGFLTTPIRYYAKNVVMG